MRRQILLCSLILVCLAACQRATPPPFEISGQTMGTTYNVQVHGNFSDAEMSAAQQVIRSTLDQVERIASTYTEDSELSRFNAQHSTDWTDASAEFCFMLETALAISRDSDGAFDPTVAALVDLWGFGPTPTAAQMPTGESVSAALRHVGYTRLETDCRKNSIRKLDPKTTVDLSGWAKGYAVDRVADELLRLGMSSSLVEVGGEVRAQGKKANGERFAIAIESPRLSTGRMQNVLHIADLAIATSGTYRNFLDIDGQRINHTLDPRTGYPVTHALIAVTVLHESAAFADGIATAILVLGPVDGMKLADRLGVAAYLAVANGDDITYSASESFDAERYFSNQARM